MMTVSEEKHH